MDGSYAWGTAVTHHPAKGLLPFLSRATEADLTATFRPTPGLRLDQTYLESRLNAWSGTNVLIERLMRSKINYQFSRPLSVRIIVDYASKGGDAALADVKDERQWRGDLLLTYLLNPGTALNLGYTDNYENLALVGDPPTVERSRWPDRSSARQVFLKLSYLRRF